MHVMGIKREISSRKTGWTTKNFMVTSVLVPDSETMTERFIIYDDINDKQSEEYTCLSGYKVIGIVEFQQKLYIGCSPNHNSESSIIYYYDRSEDSLIEPSFNPPLNDNQVFYWDYQVVESVRLGCEKENKYLYFISKDYQGRSNRHRID